MKTRSFLIATLVLGMLVFAIGASISGAMAEDGPLPLPLTHQHFNSVEGPLTQNGEGPITAGTFRNPPSPICTTSGSGANVNTD